MQPHRLFAATVLVSSAAFAQVASAASLAPQTVLPIVFTQTVSAAQAHAGDVVLAKTTQTIRLANGTTVPAGAKVTGHVVAASAFHYDSTPYAKQRPAQLAIQFDTLQTSSMKLPLHVTVRALASPIATNDASSPKSTDLDSLATTTQIGGDQLTPSQTEVRDRSGDVVAYNHRDGVYAHLIANGTCDGSGSEVSVGIFSASACGLYGFGPVALAGAPGQLALASTHGSPEIWKHSMALLEVLPEPSR
jgi:hypothetical protein